MTTVISGDTGVSQVQNNIVSPAKLTQPLTLGTAQNTTSGTSIDFTGIPAWVKRVTVMFNGVSTNGSSSLLVQIGAGSITSSGYSGVGGRYNFSSSTNGVSSTAGFPIGAYSTSTDFISGCMFICLVSGNNWISSHSVRANTTFVGQGGGDVALSGTLDRIRITTVNGTDTFDAGSVNILYEG